MVTAQLSSWRIQGESSEKLFEDLVVPIGNSQLAAGAKYSEEPPRYSPVSTARLAEAELT
jgi:hypothetical protein